MGDGMNGPRPIHFAKAIRTFIGAVALLACSVWLFKNYPAIFSFAMLAGFAMMLVWFIADCYWADDLRKQNENPTEDEPGESQ